MTLDKTDIEDRVNAIKNMFLSVLRSFLSLGVNSVVGKAELTLNSALVPV